jgi:hypothetical protein
MFNIWRKRRMSKNVDPALAAAELRSAVEIAVDEARAQHVRHYTIEQILEDAVTQVRVRYAACTPL